MAESIIKLAGDGMQPTGPVFHLKTFRAAFSHLLAVTSDANLKDHPNGISDIYEYSTLANPEDIRLMELLPGDRSAPLVRRLSIVSLGGALQYEALSYTWGDLSDRQNLYLKPGDSDTSNASTTLLKITRSLHEALMQFRDPDKSRTMWVDAVCIDQENLLERGHQVGIMRRIYHHAIRVLIWLGPEDEETFEAVNLISELNNKVERPDDDPGFSFEHPQLLNEHDVFSDWSGISIYGIKFYDYEGQEPPKAQSLAALQNLYRRPWFQRIWVVQEVTAGGSSSQIHIGSFIVPWDDFGKATLWLSLSELIDYGGPSELDTALTMWLGELLADETPPPILYKARKFLATDARDKVYALFGFPAFQRLSEEFGFKPDYTISLKEVYEKITVLSLKSSQTLEILHYVDNPALADESLIWPSWVARWDRQVAGRRFPRTNTFLSRKSQGSLSITGNPGSGILELKGVIVGHAGEVARYFKWTSLEGETRIQNPADLAQFWDDVFQNKDKDSRSQTQCDEGHITSLAKALTLHSLYEDKTVDRTRELSADIIGFLLHCFDSEPPPDSQVTSLQKCLLLLQAQYPQGSRENLAIFMSLNCTSRRLFYTADGRFGLGPMATQSGDIITVLYGGYTPFLLRPSGNDFLLVGECYVNDMMGDDVLELCKRQSSTGELEERLFRLR